MGVGVGRGRSDQKTVVETAVVEGGCKHQTTKPLVSRLPGRVEPIGQKSHLCCGGKIDHQHHMYRIHVTETS